MKTLKLFLITFLAVCSAAHAVEDKAAITLYQEGIYAERTEGDIEKAMDLYRQVLDKFAQEQKLAALATYQLGMCHLKLDEKSKAAEYFALILKDYPQQKSICKMALDQLRNLGVDANKDGMMEDFYSSKAASFIGAKYGSICGESGMQKLYTNGHAYVVDRNFYLHRGGMGYVFNNTPKPITKKYRLSGTSNKNMKFSTITGEEMDVEFVPDDKRNNFYHIYWNPKEPLEVGGFLIFGWESSGSDQLPSSGTEEKYSLKMSNSLGMHACEVFFLAVPTGTVLSDMSETYTQKERLDDWDIYWWKKIVNRGDNNVVTLSLQETAQFTQEMYNDIDSNGVIHFTNPQGFTNNSSKQMNGTSFINSDFVEVTEMAYEDGRPIDFTTTHQGNHYRYELNFDKPLQPGETVRGIVKGTITGLIKPATSMLDTYQYYMNHSPATNVPTLRRETYLLPKGAKVISTSQGMIQREKDGRIELSVEKVIPAGGSLLTTFQYRLTDAALVDSKALELDPAPWADGEVMELKLIRPSGKEYGTAIYSAQEGVKGGQDTWKVMSHMHVTDTVFDQYTFVEARQDNFLPIFAQTKNSFGHYQANYKKDAVSLTINDQTPKSVPVTAKAFDNEQALYLIRRMPLSEDYSGNFPIFTLQGGITVKCVITVQAVEELAVEAGTFTCFKTDLSIFTGGMRALQHTLWFSADKHKYLVKYDVGGSATMELSTVWTMDKADTIKYENTEPDFSVKIPSAWRYYKFKPANHTTLQLMPDKLTSWNALIWKKKGDGADSMSSMTIAKADIKILVNHFQDYEVNQSSWREFEINGLQAASYFATYNEKGNSRKKHSDPLNMIEYRTYITDQTNVYWFVFRAEADTFQTSKRIFDSIIESFELNAQ